MKAYSITLCTFYIIFILIIESEQLEDNGTASTPRSGRVSGRIVKLYSGIKNDPILCPKEGLLKDPIDCAIFYRCLKSNNGKYTVFRFQCGPGTVYDPETEVCNHPQNTRRSECGGIKKLGEYNNINELETVQNEIPYPMSADKPPNVNFTASKLDEFISDSTTITSNVPELLFPKTSISYPVSNLKNTSVVQTSTVLFDKPSTAKPFDFIKETTSSYINPSMTTKQGNVKTSSSMSYSWAPTNRNVLDYKQTSAPINDRNNEVCITEGFIGDFDNCRKFYRCVNNQHGGFIRYEFMCNELTIWDDEIRSCNHAWAVRNNRCGKEPLNYINHVDSTGQFDFNKNINKTMEYNKPEYEAEKINQLTKNKTEYQYGDKLNNIHSSTITQHNLNKIQIQSSTSSTLVTNSHLPLNYEIFTQDYNQNIYNTNDSTTKTSTLLYNDKVHTSSKDEKNQCTDSGFIGDDDDCKKFYRCVDNGRGSFTRYEFICGQGTVWDKKLEACNYEWAVEESSGESYTGNDINKLVTHELNYTSAAYPIMSEDNKHQTTRKTTTNRTPTTMFLQHQLSIIAAKCTQNGFFGVENNCEIFYRCIDKGDGEFTSTFYKCDVGYFWDSNIKSCIPSNLVKSCGSKTTINNVQPIETLPLVDSTTHIIRQEPDYDFAYGQRNTPKNEINSEKYPFTPTMKSQNKNNKCHSAGFMKDERDCKKFYRCVDNGDGSFIQHQFSCGEGTAWDSSIETCNHVWAVRSCGETNLDEPPTLTDASSPQYEDNDYVSSAHIDTNADLAATDSYTTVKPSTLRSTLPSNYQNNCSKSGFIGDTDDCAKFYRCVEDGNGGYTQYEFSCGEGTVWDSSIESCNHKWAVEGCGRTQPTKVQNNTTTPGSAMSTALSSEQSISTQYTTTGEPTSNPDSQNLVSNDDRKKCDREGFIGDKNNCKKFYRCVSDDNGDYTAYEFSCGEGTAWDDSIQSCNHANNVKNCQNQQTSDIDHSPSVEPPVHDEQVTLQNKEPTTKSPPEPLPTTPLTSTIEQSNENSFTTKIPQQSTTDSIASTDQNECEEEGFFGNKEDCKKFYRCVSNQKDSFTKYDFVCGDGTIWDQDITACNHPQDVSNPSCKTNNENDSPIPSYSDSTISTTSSSSSTSTEHQVTTTEATTTTIFTQQTPTSTASSSHTMANQNQCKEEGFFGNEEDCKKFYRCVGNPKGGFTKYEFVCGDGTIWDQDIVACNHPQDVTNPSCKTGNDNTSPLDNDNASATQTTSSSSTSTTPNSTSDINSGTTATSTTSTESSANKPNDSNYTCPEAGFFADPNDCKKFYRCVDWDNKGERFSIFHFECGEGTIWDPSLDTCNYEESVYPPRNCNMQQEHNMTQTTENTSETTTEQLVTTQETSTSTTEKSTKQTTTTKKATSKTTTTQKTTTKSTTPQSTTDQTTTQDSTSTEQTTKSTTEQSTTSEKSTTSQSTTEQSGTTTQQSTTDQNMTTEQSTTSQQPTTTEKSTTQQTTTSEQSGTTTEPVTTSSSEQSTEQTTQTDKTTTMSSTTDEQSTTSPMSTTTDNNQETSTHTSSNECPETNEGENLYVCPTSFRRHPKYCNMFYQCTEDEDSHELKLATFQCPNNTIYDESKTQCVEEKNADKKCNGNMATKHRVKRLNINLKEPIVATTGKHDCHSTGHYIFETNQECSPAFVRCQSRKGRSPQPFVYRCPEGYVYWSISRRCEAINNVKDCKHSEIKWNERHEIPIETFNIGPKSLN